MKLLIVLSIINLMVSVGNIEAYVVDANNPLYVPDTEHQFVLVDTGENSEQGTTQPDFIP